jgi:hypothetical protein
MGQATIGLSRYSFLQKLSKNHLKKQLFYSIFRSNEKDGLIGIFLFFYVKKLLIQQKQPFHFRPVSPYRLSKQHNYIFLQFLKKEA